MRFPAAVLVCAVLAGCVPADPGVAVTSHAPMVPGTVGTNCALDRAARGTQVATAPEAGRARWRIYDTAPGSTVPRTQYVTGFSDGCARQVTAALLLFGDSAVHETLRYDPSNAASYSMVDTAYERLKGSECGVGAGTPCPADRRAALDRRAVFVTIYPTFGATAGLVEMLIDGGQVVAVERD